MHWRNQAVYPFSAIACAPVRCLLGDSVFGIVCARFTLDLCGVQIQQLFSLMIFLNNPILAGLYSLIPYTVMIALDVHARRRTEQESYYVRELQPLIEKLTP